PGTLGLDPDQRRHLPKLLSDLRALAIPSATLPLVTESPVLADPAEAIGALYVIEGSTLGGQIISRLLRDSLGILPEEGGAFFSGYGAENGAMWRAFCEAVEGWARENGGVESMVVGARKTFNAMEAWLV
ncbi:biliverdin-producing heme oxygenase, partial [bacterium]